MTYNNAWIELSKSNLLFNIRAAKKLLLANTKLFAVVKSNAYGHGLQEVIKATSPYVDAFCFASPEEALVARSLTKKRLIVLSYFTTLTKKHLQTLAAKKIEIPIYSFATLHAVLKSRQQISAHIKIDTGTTRIGFRSFEVDKLINTLKKAPQIRIKGIFSHFAQAEKENDIFTNSQKNQFKQVASKITTALKLKNVTRHIACSAALSTDQQTHFDAVRLGIHLYGISGLSKGFVGLLPVLQWKTRIIQIKDVPKGTTVGYNRTYKVTKKSRIGIIPVGYWDGYPRNLSNRGYALVRGKKAFIRGTICMNLCMIDLTNIPSAKEFDEVVLIGRSANYEIKADDLAKLSGTINYEITTRINPYLKRSIV